MASTQNSTFCSNLNEKLDYFTKSQQKRYNHKYTKSIPPSLYESKIDSTQASSKQPSPIISKPSNLKISNSKLPTFNNDSIIIVFSL